MASLGHSSHATVFAVMGDWLTSVSMCPRKCAQKKTSHGYFLKIKLSHTFHPLRILHSMYRMIGKTEELCLGFFVPKPPEIRCTEVGFCQDQVWGGRRFKGQLYIFGNEKLTVGVLKQSEIFEPIFFWEGRWISHYTYFFSIYSLRVIFVSCGPFSWKVYWKSRPPNFLRGQSFSARFLHLAAAPQSSELVTW